MRKILILILAGFSITHLGFAQERAVPVLRILPEDVEQESIRQWRRTTNQFVVRWIYTEWGARKMLAFREAHEGEKTRILIGGFEALHAEGVFRPMPPYFTNYTQWKEGWIHFRTDKFIGVTEDQAKAIVAGLRKK